MIRSVRLLAALAAALVMGALTMQPALAATRASGPAPGASLSQQISALQQKLQGQLATLNSLANQEASEQASVNALDAKVAADQQREQTLNRQLDRVARVEYERPALTLVTVMDAHNLGQLLSGMAQARVISGQQQQLLSAATALRASDQRDQAAAHAQLDRISQQQSQATAIAATTRTEISTLQAQQAAEEKAAQEKAAQEKAAQQAAAQRQAQQQHAAASAPASSSSSSRSSAPPAPASSGSVQSIILAAFAPLGSRAQQWGLCIAAHESSDNPSAIQPGPNGAEGLFQFEPATWAGTPEGEAGDSIFSASASAAAAAWEYSRGNYSAWTTNADFCSMYD